MTVRANTSELRNLGGEVSVVAGDPENDSSSAAGKLAPAEGF